MNRQQASNDLARRAIAAARRNRERDVQLAETDLAQADATLLRALDALVLTLEEYAPLDEPPRPWLRELAAVWEEHLRDADLPVEAIRARLGPWLEMATR